jgi:hypothetical protein
MAGMHWPALHISPALQQPHPQETTSGLQTIPTHCPLLQIWPQPQAGLQVLPVHTPFLQLLPLGQPQVPPHPLLPPQPPSGGQTGWQQAFW